MAQSGVIATMPPDFDFDLKFNVTEYTVWPLFRDSYRKKRLKATMFNQEVRNLINNLNKGNPVMITGYQELLDPMVPSETLSTINFKLN